MADVKEETVEKTQEESTTTTEETKTEKEAAAPKPLAACRVFVGNLAYSVRTADLEEFMQKAGKIKYCEVFEYPDGRSKGSGIVEFETEADAKNAKETLQDQELSGRKIFLREDREAEKGNYQTGSSRGASSGAPRGAPRGGRGGRGGFPGGRGGFAPGTQRGDDPQCLLYVGNLNYSVSWQDLKDHFRESGFNVVRTEILGNSEGYSRGAGTVLLGTPDEAQAAINKLHNSEFRGRLMDVHLDRFAGGAPPPGGRGGYGGRGRGGRGRGE